tara:strand:+ start:395 stop:2050 length:1656 start_codon:yes stop_codon:yes gene_type:complete
MFGITWVWMNQGKISTEDLQVDPAQTLYEYFHEQLLGDYFSKDEHQFLTKSYVGFLHVTFENLPEDMLNTEGSLELYFFEKKVIQTEYEIAPQNRLEELEQNLNPLGENTKAYPLDDFNEIADDSDEIHENLSDKVSRISSQTEPLDVEFHQSHEEHDSNINVTESPGMGASKSVQESPKQFSFFKEKNSVTKYQFKYRQVVRCQKEKKDWVSLIGGHDSLRKVEISTKTKNSNNSRVNICFLIDTSQSMMKWIVGVRQQCKNIAEGVEVPSSGEVLLSLAGYGIGTHKRKELLDDDAVIHVGDVYNVVHWPFVNSARFQGIVNDFKLRTAGASGCYFAGKGTNWVLSRILEKFDNKDDTNIIIHISDEYDTTGENEDLSSICTLLTYRDDVTMYTLGRLKKGHEEPTEISGGRTWDISKDEIDVDEILLELRDEIKSMLQFDSSFAGEDSIVYEQYDYAPYYGSKTQMSSSAMKFDDNKPDGEFDGIDKFDCYYCSSDNYVKCQSCMSLSCVSDGQVSFSCQKCGTEDEIQISGKVSSSATSGNPSKKGK